MTDSTPQMTHRAAKSPVFDLVDPQLYATGDPHSIWRWLRRNEPVFLHEPTHQMPPFWVLTRYSDITSAICALMGVPPHDRDHLYAITRGAFCSADSGQRRLSHLELMEYFIGLARLRKANPQDDIISHVANAIIGGHRISEEVFWLICDSLFVGGTENVRITAAGGVLHFARNPQIWREIRLHPAVISSAVEETLRWTSTPTHLMRTVTDNTVIGGKALRRGDIVTVWPPSANRDETVFENPDVFDVGRTPNRHLALGHGEHFCIGATLARVQLSCLFQELARRYGSIMIEGHPEMIASIVVSGPTTLPVRLNARGD